MGDQSTGQPDFPGLQERLSDAIRSLGGSVFPKLNWSCPQVRPFVAFPTAFYFHTLHDSIIASLHPPQPCLLDRIKPYVCDRLKASPRHAYTSASRCSSVSLGCSSFEGCDGTIVYQDLYTIIPVMAPPSLNCQQGLYHASSTQNMDPIVRVLPPRNRTRRGSMGALSSVCCLGTFCASSRALPSSTTT